jgi:hypothetical protein
VHDYGLARSRRASVERQIALPVWPTRRRAGGLAPIFHAGGSRGRTVAGVRRGGQRNPPLCVRADRRVMSLRVKRRNYKAGPRLTRLRRSPRSRPWAVDSRLMATPWQRWCNAPAGARGWTATRPAPSSTVLPAAPSTIRYRLRRIEKRTGRSLSHPRDVAELCLAVEVHHRLI